MAEKKDLAKVEEQKAMVGFEDWGSGVDGFEDMRQEDLRLPRIKLLQPTSAEIAEEKGRPGEFYNSVTEQSFKELDVVLFQFKHQRSRWPSTFSRKSLPECRSMDGIVGQEANGDNVKCASCPHSQWGADNSPPACNESYAWNGAIFEGTNTGASIFRMLTPPSSMSAAKTFINKAFQLKGQTKAPLYAWVVKLTSTKTTNDSGTFYTVNFNFIEDEKTGFKHITPVEAKALSNQIVELSALFDAAREADLTTAPEEDIVAGEALA